jgi:peroxiredoxin Q/BCP
MAQLRQDYAEFSQRGAEIIALGPDGPRAFQRFWQEENMPFIGLADIQSKIASLYYQQVSLFKLGRMPAVFVIDKHGCIRYAHYAAVMSDIPDNREILAVLDELRQEKNDPISIDLGD